MLVSNNRWKGAKSNLSPSKKASAITGKHDGDDRRNESIVPFLPRNDAFVNSVIKRSAENPSGDSAEF